MLIGKISNPIQQVRPKNIVRHVAKGATEKETLKRCGKCHDTLYCSRACRKEHWQHHKRTCGQKHMNTLQFFLHTKTEKEVYKILFECYKMRQKADHDFAGNFERDSLYGGAPSSQGPFIRFLKKAEKKKELLPA